MQYGGDGLSGSTGIRTFIHQSEVFCLRGACLPALFETCDVWKIRATAIVRKLFRGKTMSVPRDPDLEDSVKKLLGLPPYQSPANYLYNDGYFYKSLVAKYGQAAVIAMIDLCKLQNKS
jgi:hypothetical protein